MLSKEIYKALEKAVTAAIEEMGIVEFKKCSFFMSNNK